MSAGMIIGLLAIGLLAGFMSSMIGIGGGILIVPALVMVFSMDQLKAQGTSLAMLLPPIGVLGVWQYYKNGHADLRMAGILCIAFVLGSFFGGKVVMSLDKGLVKKIFAFFLILIALKMLFLDNRTTTPGSASGNTPEARP